MKYKIQITGQHGTFYRSFADALVTTHIYGQGTQVPDPDISAENVLGVQARMLELMLEKELISPEEVLRVMDLKDGRGIPEEAQIVIEHVKRRIP